MPSTSDVLIHLDHGDSALALPEDQLVHRRQFAHLRDQVIRHLDALPDPGGSTLGDEQTGGGWTQFLDGTRGAGKSTFMGSVKKAFEDDKAIRGRMAFIGLIDPSRLELSEVPLLLILQRLKKRVDSELKGLRHGEDERIRDEWRQAFKSVAGGLSLFARDYHPLDGHDPDLFLDWGLERASDGASLRARLHQLFAIACRILGVKALMWAFDDGDTNASQAIAILECIRKYLDAPLVMVMVTGDMELYSLLVRRHFAKTVADDPKAALDLTRNSKPGDRSLQYLRMIDHLEEQYLLKLFPIRRRSQLLPLRHLMERTDSTCRVTSSAWVSATPKVQDLLAAIVKRGLRVKTAGDVALYVEFLATQPLRSVLQVMSKCSQHLSVGKDEKFEDADWSTELTEDLAGALQSLGLTSLYKFALDVEALSDKELDVLTQAVFDLSLLDGDLDTAPYLRPMSANQDIRSSFMALAAEVPKVCALQPGTTLRYLLRGPGSVSLYALAEGQMDPGLPEDLRRRRFKDYIGMGRKEDALDWGRRATAVIALPYSINPKVRVVLPGVIGLNRKRRHNNPNEMAARTAISNALSDKRAPFPVFALALVDVSSPSGTRTYASIFVLLGIIEKLLSSGLEESNKILDRVYPALTVSAPSWSRAGSVTSDEGSDPAVYRAAKEEDLEKRSDLWSRMTEWREESIKLKDAISPSAVALGKVWSRIFFSLQNACDDLRPHADFCDVMEIFAQCVINAFLVEESEHHLLVKPSATPTPSVQDRRNPRVSTKVFIDKLKGMSFRRDELPLTSIVATCPLILGLLESTDDVANALIGLFPAGTDKDSIKLLLRPAALAREMKKISIAGGPATAKPSASTDNSAPVASVADDEL
ncbi:hypothetical protein EIP75_21800 [Aquabacterium soli]|uniref:KAP NTPase domain-containing protein n=1 Tax=Aquabacterium soli TaxID=2493092 RepID=A0A3R8TPY0_9BURK|nr:hypothetical protein [Aquabacterium soli]RRS01107.1 hypothetical protein EIP75_21800 [Aquabacterium soli]